MYLQCFTLSNLSEEIVVPITRVQVQQLQFAVQSGQVEMLALSAQFLAHYADVIPQNSLVGSEVLDCTLALMELDHLEVSDLPCL